MKTSEITEQSVREMSNDDVLQTFGIECACADRCVGRAETNECFRLQRITEAEMLRRMQVGGFK